MKVGHLYAILEPYILLYRPPRRGKEKSVPAITGRERNDFYFPGINFWCWRKKERTGTDLSIRGLTLLLPVPKRSGLLLRSANRVGIFPLVTPWKRGGGEFLCAPMKTPFWGEGRKWRRRDIHHTSAGGEKRCHKITQWAFPPPRAYPQVWKVWLLPITQPVFYPNSFRYVYTA